MKKSICQVTAISSQLRVKTETCQYSQIEACKRILPQWSQEVMAALINAFFETPWARGTQVSHPQIPDPQKILANNFWFGSCFFTYEYIKLVCLGATSYMEIYKYILHRMYTYPALCMGNDEESKMVSLFSSCSSLEDIMGTHIEKFSTHYLC